MNINATLFVQALSFAALIWFSVRFVWPMITDAMMSSSSPTATVGSPCLSRES